jgi:hypothetical protein
MFDEFYISEDEYSSMLQNFESQKYISEVTEENYDQYNLRIYFIEHISEDEEPYDRGSIQNNKLRFIKNAIFQGVRFKVIQL